MPRTRPQLFPEPGRSCSEWNIAVDMAGPAGPVNVIATGGELTGPAEARDIYAARHAAFAEIVRDRGVSPQRLTLAWMLALAPTVIPIPGASRPESVTDSAQAADLTLTSEEVARLS